MLQEIVTLIIKSLFTLYLVVVILRFLLQLVRADFYNPLSQFIVKATTPPLRPLRRIIPGFGGVDIACVVLALLVQLLATSILLLVHGFSLPSPILLLIWALLGCIGMTLQIYFFGILIYIIASWIAPGSYNPALLLVQQLIEPVMAPFRRIIPPLGGLDLSPIVVFLVLNILKIVVANFARSTGLGSTWMIIGL